MPSPSRDKVRDALLRVNASDITCMKGLLDLIEETGVDMRRAFRYMALDGMDFADVDLTGYDFSWCNLDGADFRAARNWEKAQFTDAYGEARFPDGLTTARALERVKALRDIEALITRAMTPDDDSALGDAGRGPTLHGFIETMVAHVDALADQSHDPEKARRVAREAMQSLSLSRPEVARVFQALPTLSDFQMNELLKVFAEERQKFLELSQDHVADVLALALARSGPNRGFFQTVAQAHFPEGPAHKVAGQLLMLPGMGEAGDLFAAAAGGLGTPPNTDMREPTQFRLLSSVVSALPNADERFADLAPILQERAVSAAGDYVDELKKRIRTLTARTQLDELDGCLTVLATLPGTKPVAEMYIRLVDTMLDHRLLDAADDARRAFADRVQAPQGFEAALYPWVTMQQAWLSGRLLQLQGEYALAVSILEPRLTPVVPSDPDDLARIKALLASLQSVNLVRLGRVAEAMALMDQLCETPPRRGLAAVQREVRENRVEALLLAGNPDRARREAMDLSDPTSARFDNRIIMPFLAWVAGADKRWLRRAVDAAAKRGARKGITWDFHELGIIIPRLPPKRRATAQAVVQFLRGRLSVAEMERHIQGMHRR